MIKSGSLSITERLTGCDMPTVELFKYKFNMFFFPFIFYHSELDTLHLYVTAEHFKAFGIRIQLQQCLSGDLELGSSDFWQMPEV